MNQQIIDNNYLYIPQFITQDRAYELAARFSHFCQTEDIPNDVQAQNSHSAYNYIDFLELLCEKTPEISKYIGETVLPTYSYARVYKENSDLEIHKDRDECEISVTLHLAGDEEWPIHIIKPNGEKASINLNSGDAMIYLGCDAEHYRETYAGKQYVQVFLHYVKSRGSRNQSFFDNKNINRKLLIENSKSANDTLPAEVNKNTYKKNLEDYIVIFEDILPHELCDSILSEYKNSNEWSPTIIGSGNIKRDVRNTDTISLSLANTIEKNIIARKEIDENLYKVANQAIIKYNSIFPNAHIEQDSGYELLRYNTGQFYVQHTDSFMKQPRAVSCSFALNDDYEGGEFAFWDREKKVTLKKGSAILFPSNFMYPHEIMPVTKGTRYSIVTWFI